MKVTCPECNFSNEIPEDKIPANAQLATCPKCQIKFQFRDLGQEQEPVPGMEFENSTTPQEQESYEQHSNAAENTEMSAQQEPVEQNTYEQESPRQDQTYVPEEQPEHVQDDKSDIWQRLDSMKPEEKESQDEAAYEEEVHVNGQEVPFEHLEKYGFFPGLILTIKNIILSPASFFQGMELKGFIKPLIFFILLAEFQEICNFIWATTGVDTSIGSDVGRMVNDSVIADSLKEGSASALFSLLLYPLMLAGLSFPLIGVTHILLMIFGAGDRGYEATFRATAYSYAPIVLCVIPFVGDMIGALVSMAISIIAYKNIHNTTYMRVVLSMVMPIVLLLVILGFYMNFNQPTI